ncbi:DNA repair protein RadC [uncultured Eubacterium sp.]|uniref:RadC family protein n=1 Tax=uncultured Eubacterium sp. TaxID=165185 RepID=UPI0025CDE7F8|nr:DNA repair protein RadC [uncultured Eubacterium sp.]
MQKNMTVKELPDTERPYEKCLMYGADALTDAELISVIIRTGSRGERCVDLAHRILNAGPDGLLNLLQLDVKQLTKIHGIGNVKAVQLKCVGELAKRIASTRRRQQVVLESPESIASYYMERMRHEAQEILVLAMFDSKSMLIGEKVISVGTSNAALISPREIYRTALQEQAVYIVILHNHPSGNPEPSREDVQVTRKIKQSGEILDILLMDHIIIGDNRYFSFREQDILFEKGRE